MSVEHLIESISNSSAAEAAWRRAGVPERLSDCRLAGSPQERLYPDLVKRLTAPDMGAAGWKGFWHKSWLLWGPIGAGKSGLAAAYAYQWVDPAHGDPAVVRWYSVPYLLATLRETYGGRRAASRGPNKFVAAALGLDQEPSTEGEILRRCWDADLLVLDDLGAEHVSGSGWVEERLYLIVDRRHGQGATTFFTSNLSPAELSEQIGDRTVSRILEMCGGKSRVFHMDGPNLRIGGGR